MEIHKIGGSSLADIATFRSTMQIMLEYPKGKRMIVISAVGKTTNALEDLIVTSRAQKPYSHKLQDLLHFHLSYVEGLSLGPDAAEDIERLMDGLEVSLSHKDLSFNEHYDQIIGYGEKLSSTLAYHYLKSYFPTKLLAAEDLLVTDSVFRRASIMWDESKTQILALVHPALEDHDILITQGFIARSTDGRPTSLGREGSDFTGAILASILECDKFCVWKDVASIYSADPKLYSWAEPIPQMDYKEMIEMGYYGAKVIHPRTIKPLENKRIPLEVKCFLDSSIPGTRIHNAPDIKYPPIIVLTTNQVLCKIRTEDLSYVTEKHLEVIFRLLAQHHLKINLMRNSALSFQICFDYQKDRAEKFLQELSQKFSVNFLDNLQLMTIRHSDDEALERLLPEGNIYFHEKFGNTVQILFG